MPKNRSWASNYTYAEATWTQQLPDWIGSHVRALTFIGGSPKVIVPDNLPACRSEAPKVGLVMPDLRRDAAADRDLKSGVHKPCFFEPRINRTYADLASHYGTVVIPARPRKPRDKAKAEVGVQIVERWVLAKLRNRRFTSLATLNLAIFQLVDELNRKPSRHLGASRLELFHQIDRPALSPLSADTYEYAEWKECRVGIDYHVEIDKHYYSVPHSLRRQPISARISAARPTSNNLQERTPMLLHPTLSQLDQLDLAGMAKAFRELADNPEAKALDHAEWLGLSRTRPRRRPLSPALPIALPRPASDPR